MCGALGENKATLGITQGLVKTGHELAYWRSHLRGTSTIRNLSAENGETTAEHAREAGGRAVWR